MQVNVGFPIFWFTRLCCWQAHSDSASRDPTLQRGRTNTAGGTTEELLVSLSSLRKKLKSLVLVGDGRGLGIRVRGKVTEPP